MSFIDYLNELIDYSMGFPFYQRLNPLFNGISSKDAPLSSGRSILARPTQSHSPGRAPKCFNHLIYKGVSLLDVPLNNGFDR